MKRTIRLIAVILAAVVLAAAFAGCTGKSSPAGLYKIKSIDGMPAEEYYEKDAADGGSTLEEFKAMLALLGFNGELNEFMTIELIEGGKCIVNVALEDPSEGTWKLEGNKLTIDVADDGPQELEYKDGLIYVDTAGAHYVFER